MNISIELEHYYQVSWQSFVSFKILTKNTDRIYVFFAARNAFVDVGKKLQKRRKADLYEMVQYFTGNQTDPAGEDPLLKTKLEENQKKYSKRMTEVIDK